MPEHRPTHAHMSQSKYHFTTFSVGRRYVPRVYYPADLRHYSPPLFVISGDGRQDEIRTAIGTLASRGPCPKPRGTATDISFGSVGI